MRDDPWRINRQIEVGAIHAFEYVGEIRAYLFERFTHGIDGVLGVAETAIGWIELSNFPQDPAIAGVS